MIRFLPRTALICITLLCGCGNRGAISTESEAWDDRNDPARFGAVSQHYLEIPTHGSLDSTSIPWSAGYWPTYRGGVANRWQTPAQGTGYAEYLYEVLSPEAAAELSENQISALSPAEKYDLLLGRLDFPLVHQQQAKTLAAVRNGEVPSWFGLCHGWAAAAIAEPMPAESVVMRDPNDRVIRFTPVDIAGLTTALYGDLLFPLRVSGTRCNSADPARDERGRITLSKCRDVNPATFHLHLAKFIGQNGQSFVADFYRGDQVWNFPIHAYKFAYENLRELTAQDELFDVRAPDTVYLVDVKLVVSYTPLTPTHLSPRQGLEEDVELLYSLELDADKFIVGGEWISDSFPDFLWTVDGVQQRTLNPHLDAELIRDIHAQSVSHPL